MPNFLCFLLFSTYQAPGAISVWPFAGPNDSLGAFGGGGAWPRGPSWIRLCPEVYVFSALPNEITYRIFFYNFSQVNTTAKV